MLIRLFVYRNHNEETGPKPEIQFRISYAWIPFRDAEDEYPEIYKEHEKIMELPNEIYRAAIDCGYDNCGIILPEEGYTDVCDHVKFENWQQTHDIR